LRGGTLQTLTVLGPVHLRVGLFMCISTQNVRSKWTRADVKSFCQQKRGILLSVQRGKAVERKLQVAEL